MPPVVAFAAAIYSTAVTALAAFVGKTLAVAIIKTALTFAVSAAASAIFAPKLKNTFQRQAEVLSMQLGETPRAALFGKAATGGSLADAFNHGSDNEWETIVVAIADHQCHSLTGFIVNDKEYAFSANGAQSAFNEGSTASLYLYWYPGTTTQTASTYLTANSGGRWTSNDKFTGVSYVVASYRFSEKIWPQGRPRFRWISKGKLCYDPRLDDTVDGGDGAHRWDDPATHEWSENAQVCEFNWRRGVWSNGQLMVGPGRAPEEAPADAFTLAAMNLCDEDVALKAGGTVKRYTVSAVILANERWIDTQADFARAMAGDLIDRSGVTQPDPGSAKTAEFTFTDHDLIEGGRCEFRRWLTREESCNTVTTRYIEPTKLWQPHSAPLRRNQDDIDTDGEPREATCELPFVYSRTQAQRVAEIMRRKARMQRQATVTLPPEFMGHETGDWIEWQSDLYLGGATVTFEVRRVTHFEDGTVELGLREIASTCFSWTPSTDELDETSEGFVAGPLPPAATLSGFSASAVTVTNGGAVTPAIKALWTPAADGSIAGVLVEWRKLGTTTPVFAKFAPYVAGEAVLADGLVGGATFQVRATPVSSAREATPTSWLSVTIAAQVSNDVSAGVGKNCIIDGDFRQVSAGYWTYGVASPGVGGFTANSANALRYFEAAATSVTIGGAIYIMGGAGNHDSFQVAAGTRVELSAYVGSINISNLYVIARFYDAAGAYAGDEIASHTLAPTAVGAGTLGAYQRVGGIVTAPAAARRATILVYALAGASAPTLRVTRPYIGFAGPNQTDLTPWNIGFEAALGADVTAANTAAAIAGQGTLATLSSVTAAQVAANTVSEIVTVEPADQSFNAVSLNLTTAQTFATLSSLTTDAGDKVILQAAFTLVGSATSGGLTIEVKRGGTTIKTLVAGSVGIDDAKIIYGAIPVLDVDAPSAGSQAYTLTVKSDVDTGTITVSNITFMATRLRR